MLDSAACSILKHVGEFEDDSSEDDEVFEAIEKPPLFRFDFVELCGGLIHCREGVWQVL